MILLQVFSFFFFCYNIIIFCFVLCLLTLLMLLLFISPHHEHCSIYYDMYWGESRKISNIVSEMRWVSFVFSFFTNIFSVLLHLFYNKTIFVPIMHGLVRLGCWNSVLFFYCLKMIFSLFSSSSVLWIEELNSGQRL